MSACARSRNYIDGRWVDGGGAIVRKPRSRDRRSRRDRSRVRSSTTCPRRSMRHDGRSTTPAGRPRPARSAPRSSSSSPACCARSRRPLAELVASEMGKPIRYVREREIEPAIDRILFYAGAARTDPRRGHQQSAPGHLLNFILKEPVGVCGLITPWNDPVDLPLRKIGAAIATGCTFVLKPASDAPASSMAIFELLDRIEGLPQGVANGVVGQGEVIGEALASRSARRQDQLHRQQRGRATADGARRPELQARRRSRAAARRRSSSSRMRTSRRRWTPWRSGSSCTPASRAPRARGCCSTARSTTRSSTA